MQELAAAIASSTAYWMIGLSMIGSSSFGIAFVAGRKRVPRPATGKTALVIDVIVSSQSDISEAGKTGVQDPGRVL